MNTFTNKVVVVTGGNSGMGLAAAQEFSRRGAKVVISGRDEKTLAAAAVSIGGEILAVRADVARLSDLDDLFARTKKKFGSIDRPRPDFDAHLREGGGISRGSEETGGR